MIERVWATCSGTPDSFTASEQQRNQLEKKPRPSSRFFFGSAAIRVAYAAASSSAH
jgi:hypothetical protein